LYLEFIKHTSLFASIRIDSNFNFSVIAGLLKVKHQAMMMTFYLLTFIFEVKLKALAVVVMRRYINYILHDELKLLNKEMKRNLLIDI